MEQRNPIEEADNPQLHDEEVEQPQLQDAVMEEWRERAAQLHPSETPDPEPREEPAANEPQEPSSKPASADESPDRR